GGSVPPQLVLQLMHGHGLASPQQQDGQHGFLLVGGDVDQPVAVPYLEATEDPELHHAPCVIHTVRCRRIGLRDQETPTCRACSPTKAASRSMPSTACCRVR